ncbi:MAG: phosphate ABC transporter permease subunit PstC [Acidimicrobiales bacterium]|jgi:phosphate transport system permease protein
MSVDLPTIAPGPVVPEPITISTDYSNADRFYRRGVWVVSMGVLVLLFLIGLFLLKSGLPAFREAGWNFFTRSGFQTLGKHPVFGVLASLVGTLEVAGVAMVVGTPVAIGTALFLSEYAPLWSRRPLISMIDLAAAIPSIVFGLWAVFELETNVVGFSTWLSRHLSFIPFFKVNSPPLNASLFIAGLVVGLMIVPIVASISREVFSLAPPGEREAALALGASRWQMIRTVVLPFGRGGMIGAVMLGLGRALEETIAVSIILGTAFRVSPMILQHGGSTISQLIAVNFGSGGTLGLQDLLFCGFVLFVITLVVNLIASAIINRSRSGAGVDL